MEVAGRHLHVVDAETGQELEDCPGCLERQHQLDQLTRKYHGALGQIGRLQADKAAEARAHPLWPRAMRHFERWQTATGHTRAEWSADKFWQAEPYLRRNDETYIDRAIDGLAFDPYKSKPLKNGRIETYDGWSNLFKNEDALARYHNRAPIPREIAHAEIELPPHELNLAAYAPDGVTPYHGPLPEEWASA